MDDFSEKQADNQKSEEESTVFSAPQSHNDNGLKSSKKSRIIAALSALLAVLILVGGTLAVIKLIPKKEEEKTPEAKKIAVLNFDKNKFDTVTVENKNGQFVLFPKAGQNAESTESADSKWYVKDLAEEKISVSKTDDIVSAAANIEAIIEITKKTFDDCGFEEPVLKVSVASQELGDYFLLFGAASPDNSGIYLYSSVDEKIYLVQMSVYESFEFSVLDLANIESVSPLSENSEVAGFFKNGNLTSFDELSVSSSGFSEKIIIKLLSDEEASKFGFSYKVISPNERFADTSAVDSLLSAFTSEITVSGVYSFNTDSADMSTFGLDDPDFAVSLLLGGHKFTYKFALQSDGFYALFGDGMNTIKKVSASSARYLSLEAIDFYNKAVYIRPLSEIKASSQSSEH